MYLVQLISRWSCTVCKNFDLCDKCYKEGGEFPEPHKADHNMVEHMEVSTPAPTKDGVKELVPPGVESEDEETLMQLAVEMSLQDESAPPPSITNISSGYATKEMRSKLASMVLGVLVDRYSSVQQKGGAVAVPFFQVIFAGTPIYLFGVMIQLCVTFPFLILRLLRNLEICNQIRQSLHSLIYSCKICNL